MKPAAASRIPAQMDATIRREIERSADSCYDYRLHAVLLVCRGRSCREVAAFLQETPRTIQRWARRFREHGCAGLRDATRPGRPRSLSAADRRVVHEHTTRPPLEFGLGGERWTALVLQQHLRMRFGIEFSVRHCRRILRELTERPSP